MSKVYVRRADGPDRYLGHVTEDGRVFRGEPGSEEEIGWAEASTGKIYSLPDSYSGRVQLETGKVFAHVPITLDDYLGEVRKDGKMYRHEPNWPDEYIGYMDYYRSVAQGAPPFCSWCGLLLRND